MPIPTAEKTWQFDVNSAQGNTGTQLADLQQVLHFFKTACKGFASYAWTCSGSSDSSTAGMDGSDRLTAYTNWVWGTGAHSWIVLRQTGIATTFEVCIDLNSADYDRITVVVSTAGFTGGSTTARPTATDEYAVYTTAAYWTDNYGSSQQYKCHCMMSDDGQVTRYFVFNTYQGYPVTVFTFEKPKDPISTWTDPWFSIIYGSTNRTISALALATWNDSANVKFRQNSVNATAYIDTVFCISSTFAEQAAGQKAHDVSSEWPFYGMKIYSETVGAVGKVGIPYDLYFGPTSGLTVGDQYDATPSRLWAYGKDFIFPFNGTVIQVT